MSTNDTITIAAIGDLHVTETSLGQYAALFREMSEQADVIVLAGKGHEDYQEVGGERQPFSDLIEAEKALALWEAAHA